MTDLLTVPAPGVHQLTDDEYFGGELARTSLSSTGVRLILSSPAKFRHRQLHPEPPKRTFDIGHAAHQLVLGEGPELVRIDAEKWLTNAVKAEVQAVRDRGAVPLKPADWDAVHAMAAKLQEHPHAPKLLSRGRAERTLIWVDEDTGVLCRAKADWLRPDGIVDYKTAADASLGDLRKTVWNLGYWVQAAFYLRGFRALMPLQMPFFGWIAQEKEAPHLVQTFQIPEDYLAAGDRQCSKALAEYARCAEADDWPGYPSDDIHEIEPPAWVRLEDY